MIRAGTFNGGFIGVSRRPAGPAFLDWWYERLLTHNRMDPAAGLHHDQRWLDLVPPFFGDLGIVRDPGCNVAYWNLGERGVHVVDGRVMAGEVPLRFFHFSGFNPAAPMPLSRHARVSGVDGLDVAGDLARRYSDLLHASGWLDARATQYSYGVFEDGVPVPVAAQQMFRALGDARQQFDDPFADTASTGVSFREWLMAPDARAGQGQGLPRLWRQIYDSRGDLQGAFPEPAGADAQGFAAWARDFGVTEHNVDARLLAPDWRR
ncbi:MAG: hypothetical protein IT178_13140 [Acidobacteria bacterium]|nr:hypothetical protein [Acidobacteriota bacterium]